VAFLEEAYHLAASLVLGVPSFPFHLFDLEVLVELDVFFVEPQIDSKLV
jgi:hypothetical protein